jgi:hypothetical protein
MAHNLSDALFEIKEKLTDQEYKTIMEITKKVFDKTTSKYYKITHLEPRFVLEDDEEDDEEYYKLTLVPCNMIVKVSDKLPEKLLTEDIPNDLLEDGYSIITRNDDYDMLNNTSDTPIRNTHYHIIKIVKLED